LFFLIIPLIDLVRQMGKAEREGDAQQANRFMLSYLISQFNPFTIGRALMQQFGQLLIWLRYWRGLPAPDTFTAKCTYYYPFHAGWTLGRGGLTREDSHSWSILTQRYAYDFVQQDEQGKSHQNEGRQLSDYYCYGAEILAPAAGTVVQVRDGIRDFTKVDGGSIDAWTRDFRGNFVVIRHAQGEYSCLAHLQPSSIHVQRGESVATGQCLGYCGNSGHSTEPHLHVHLMDHPNFYLGMGLPLRFREKPTQSNPEA